MPQAHRLGRLGGLAGLAQGAVFISAETDNLAVICKFWTITVISVSLPAFSRQNVSFESVYFFRYLV